MELDVALIYNPRDRGINGRHWKVNSFKFFREELPQHVKLKEYSVRGGLDCSDIKCDVAILYNLLPRYLDSMKLKGFEDMKCVKVTRAPDAWQIDDTYNETAKRLGIDLIVSFQSPNCQYTYLDKDIRYERFILGIDPEMYPNPDNWESRTHRYILSSGVLGGQWFYQFRYKCTQSPYVEHYPKGPLLGTSYWKLLTRYRAAIACMSFTSVLKYFEIPMCGCLMFAEVNENNQIRDLGFIDGVNCIYVDESNYRKRFQEFIEDFNNPKWKRIADTGHKLVKNTYSNQKEVKRFVKTLESLVGARC